MRLTIILFAIAAAIAVYITWVRPYLKTLPSFAQLWKSEETAWGAIKAWVMGRRTILIGLWGELAIWLPDMIQSLNLGDVAIALHWDDAKKAIANIVLTLLMLIFRAKASP